jgi:hypothetical protein
MWKASNSAPTLQSTPQHSLSAYHSPVFCNFITVHLHFRCKNIYIFFLNNPWLLFLISTKHNSILNKNGEDSSSKMSLLFQSFNSSSIISLVSSEMHVLHCGFVTYQFLYINHEYQALISLSFCENTDNVGNVSHWYLTSCLQNINTVSNQNLCPAIENHFSQNRRCQNHVWK